MSFTKTISTVAALASIFGAGAAGWKLAQNDNQSQPQSVLDQRIEQLERQLEEANKQPVVVEDPQPTLIPAPAQVPKPVSLPQATPVSQFPPTPPAPQTQPEVQQ